MGLQALSGACSTTGLPLDHSLLPDIPLLQCGSPPWAPGGSLHSHGPSWGAGAQLPHHGLHQELHRNLISGTQSISSPAFSTDLGVSGAVLLQGSHLAFLWPQLQLYENIVFLLKSVITEVLPSFLVCPALTSSTFILEPPGINSAGHGHHEDTVSWKKDCLVRKFSSVGSLVGFGLGSAY